MQGIQKGDQRFDLSGGKIFAIGRHVSAAGHNLEAQLIEGHARGNIIERRTALAALAANGVAIAALLALKNGSSLTDER
jgi:hypothetical protein